MSKNIRDYFKPKEAIERNSTLFKSPADASLSTKSSRNASSSFFVSSSRNNDNSEKIVTESETSANTTKNTNESFGDQDVSMESLQPFDHSENDAMNMSGVVEVENGNTNDLRPSCWTERQTIEFKEKNPWLIVGSKLACETCRIVSTLGTEKSSGLKLSQNWIKGTITCNGDNIDQQQTSLRKKIHEHKNSKAHEAADKILVQRKKKALESSFSNMRQHQQVTTERIFRSAYKQAKLNRPFYEFETEIDLQICNGLDMGRILHSNVACANIVHHISSEMKKGLVNQLLENNAKFSLTIDESTSLSNKSCLVVYIRTRLEGMKDPHNIFLTLIELCDLSAAGILKSMLDDLKRLGLTENFIQNNLISFTSDGAAVMLGKKSGLSKLLRDKYPGILIWHCLNHRLELSVHDSIEEVTGINHFKIFMDKVRSVYSASPKNSRQLEECAKDLHQEILKIGRVLDVRWVASSFRTVKAVWQDYKALHKHFEQASNDYTRDSGDRSVYSGLVKMLSSASFVHNLALMYDALEELADLSLQLQNSSVNLIQAHNDISMTIKVFESRIDHPGRSSILADASIEQMNFKDVTLIERSKVPKIQSKQFYRSLTNNMTHRLFDSKNCGEKFEDIMDDIKVVYPRYWPESGNIPITYGEEKVIKLCERFKINHPQSLIRDFRIYKQGIQPIFTGNKANILEEPPKVNELMSIINTIAVSSAEAERGFSNMNLIVTPSRCSLNVDTVSDLLFIRLVGPPICEYNPQKHVKSWLAKGHHSAIDFNSKERSHEQFHEDNYILWKCF